MMDGDRWTYKKFDSTGSVSLGNRYFLKANNKYYSFCLAENGDPLPGVNMILDNACVFALYPDLKYRDSSDCAEIEINNIRPQAGMLIWSTPDHNQLKIMYKSHGIWEKKIVKDGTIEDQKTIEKKSGFSFSSCSFQIYQIKFTYYFYDSKGLEYNDTYLYVFASGYGMISERYSWSHPDKSTGKIYYLMTGCKLKTESSD